MKSYCQRIKRLTDIFPIVNPIILPLAKKAYLSFVNITEVITESHLAIRDKKYPPKEHFNT